jgi:hypothetical protein
MFKLGRVLAAIFLLAFIHAASAASLKDKFMPGTPYYFTDFDPGKQPWEPGQFLNFEEVFKNYQYYEIVFDQDGNGITVNHYLRGNKESSEKYLVFPDNSLKKMSRNPRQF